MSRKIIFLVLVLLIFSSLPAAGEVYVVFTDREFGFWGVRSYNVSHISYVSRTLDINTGDSIEWVNMDTEGDRITIVSDNILWEGGKALGSTRSKFRFTFNSSGYYKFHIVENMRVKLISSNNYKNESTENTTITYEDDDGELHTITVNKDYLPKDEISTEQYRYQRMIIRVTGPTIGNGTFPIKTIQKASTPFTAVISSAVNVTAKATISPTPTKSKSLTQALAEEAVTKPLESYQEFTIYAVLKRWMDIIMNG